MNIFDLTLVLATVLCSLVAGFLFCYAIVIMPGIKTLDAKMFLKTFQVTDRVIQDKQPLFIFVWLGSVVALIISAAFGFDRLEGTKLMLLIVAASAYLVGVQWLTVTVHLPLNNKLQKLDIESMNEEALNKARTEFEGPWNRSNQRRTAFACCTSILLLALPLIE